MAKRWLTALVRARELQETAAKQQLAAARRDAARAATRVRYDRERLKELAEADALESAPAFVAAAVALQASAATHAAAVRAARAADEAVDRRRDELNEAARARRTAEELHVQHLAELASAADAVAQRELDEIAARVHRDGALS